MLNILRCSLLVILGIGLTQGSVVSPTITTPLGENQRRLKADELLKHMNKSANPCEDFYEFACGNYAKYNPASEDEPGTGMLETLQRELNTKIKTILSTEERGDGGDIDKKVKQFYRACVQFSHSLESSYSDKLKEIIKEFGQMPALVGDQWRESDFNWLQTVGAIAFKYGISIFTLFEFSMDFANNTVNRIYISEQDSELPGGIYTSENFDKIMPRLAKFYAMRLTKFLGIEESLAVNETLEMVKLEQSLAVAMVDKQAGDRMNDTYILRSLDEAQQKFSPGLDLKQLVEKTVGYLPKLKVYTDDGYLANLIEVLQHTPKKTLANYIFYKVITAFTFDFPETETEIDDLCIAQMKTHFYKNFDNMVYRKYYTKDAEQGINDMWQQIKTAFRNRLASQSLNWITEDTRKYAMEKVDSMKLDIISYEKTNFSEILGNVKFNNRDYIGNLKELLMAKASSERAHIGEEAVRKLDYGSEISTTPAYISVENAIKMPVALLQPYSVWSTAFPNAFNFGVLGSLLAHELIHGFDGSGHTFDALGNNRNWWDLDSENEFSARSQCLINQYKKYIYAGQHLSEMPNQDENIADNGGVRLAYAAYLQWHENATSSGVKDTSLNSLESFPGLDFNHKQLFFLSYGHLWCADSYLKIRAAMMTTDIHVPDKFRVIGPLSNFQSFSKEFNCTMGSSINPTMKCKIY